MRKILLVSRCAWTLYNFRQGLIRWLTQHGYEVWGGGAGGDGYESRIEALGIPFVRLPVARNAVHPLADLCLLWTLFRWYRKQRPDLVHHFTIKPVIYGSLAARLAGVPRIVNTITGLGFVFTGAARPLLRRLVEMLYRLALSQAHYTFFQNEDDRRFFLARGLVSPERTGLLPGSGVDTQHFRPLQAKSACNTVTFLMVSRLLRDKGIYEFVDAARLIKGAHPEARFLLLGARDVRNPTVVPEADIQRWQREQTVQWLGEVVDVRSVLGDADVVVLPSYREGTPRALLEAAAMGKPIITTDIVGCREVVDDGVNGLLVPLRDVAALASAMDRLLNDGAMRQTMGVAGRDKVVRFFDESKVISRVVAAYEGSPS